MADLKVEGLVDLKRILAALPARVEGNVMRGAMRAGGNVFKKEAASRVPVDEGDLKKSISVKADRKALKAGVVRVRIVAGSYKAFYAHFVEYGTASYYTGEGRTVGKPYKIKPKKRGGALFFGGTFTASVIHPGVKPRPFMRPAVDAGTRPAIDAVVDYLKKRLPKEVEKAGL